MALEQYLAKLRPSQARKLEVLEAEIIARRLAKEHAEKLFDSVPNADFATSSVREAYLSAIKEHLSDLQQYLKRHR